jgi:hypothetical protein
MPKNKISEWSSTAANNTDIGGIDIAEGCAPSGINNAIREIMAQVKDMITGTDGDNLTVGGNLSVTGTTTATGAITANGGVIGNVTGNVTGNLTGNVTGNASTATTATTATSATTATNIAGGGAGQVPYNSASGTTAFLAAGTSGQFLQSNGTSAPSWGDVRALTLDTEKASTSGTAIDFAGIPSWVKRITVMFNGVSTNGSSNLLIQLGDAGGFETTGYASYSCKLGGTSVSSGGVSTSGFIADIDTTSSSLNGSVFISKLSGNIWVANGFLTDISNSLGLPVSGSKTLSDVLTSIRITTSNGAETFDAGSINIMYE